MSINYKFKNKLKFLIIAADKFPPFRSDVAILFGKEMISRGHTIDWILQSEQLCNKNYTTSWKNGHVYVGRTNVGPSSFMRVLKHIYSILNDFKSFTLLKNNNYDIVQVKDKFISTILIIFLAKINKLKFTYWLSYPYPEASLYSAKYKTARYPIYCLFRGYFLKFILYKVIMPFSDHIFVQSDQMKKDVVSMGIIKDKITPVPMGIEDELVSQYKPITNTNIKTNTTILYLGTMASVRKIDFLIRVFKIVYDVDSNINYIMVGGSDDPVDIDNLKLLSSDLGISSNVIFTGNIPRSDALNYVTQSDICVSPFYPTPILNSTSPTKLIEYMALGKPVVANNHPEQSKIISESKAGICVPYKENAFANAILELASSPEKSKHMGILGKKYVAKFRTYSKIADTVEQIYQSLIK